MKPAAKKPTAK